MSEVIRQFAEELRSRFSAPDAALELAAEVARRTALPRTGTVRHHLETDPGMVELCVFFNPKNSTWTAYPVGGIFTYSEAPDYVVSDPSPEAAVAAVLALEVLE